VAHQAAKLVEAHWNSPNTDETPQRFASSYIAAYLPIVDRQVFFTELKRRAAKSRERDALYRRLDPSPAYEGSKGPDVQSIGVPGLFDRHLLNAVWEIG